MHACHWIAALLTEWPGACLTSLLLAASVVGHGALGVVLGMEGTERETEGYLSLGGLGGAFGGWLDGSLTGTGLGAWWPLGWAGDGL